MKIPRHPARLAALLLALNPAFGEEVHSNARGGGPWSETTTWFGKKIPSATDTVVIAAKDAITFDRDDKETVSCKSLAIDPNGMLILQKGGGKRRMNVAGPIESYGTIRLDGTGSDEDSLELRLVSEAPEERYIVLQANSSLILNGREGLAEGRCNVTLSSLGKAFDPTPMLGWITAGSAAKGGRCLIDLQRANVVNIQINACGIDNTGSKSNERLNLVQNRFDGMARVNFTGCDTPTIAKNQFTRPKGPALNAPAINLMGCPLAEIQENTIKGPFSSGMQVSGECSAIGNIIEQCGYGIQWQGSNAIIKQNTMRDCAIGIRLDKTSGTVEECAIENPGNTGIQAHASNTQLTNVSVTGLSTNAVALSLAAESSLTLLNCNIQTNHVSSLKPVNSALQTMNFVVVKVKGQMPPGTVVELTTAHPSKPLKEGAMDLNIRNSPAMFFANGMTSLPGLENQTPLIVRSWSINRVGKPVAPPEYKLSLFQPAQKPDEKPKLLKSINVTPDATWFRPKPSEPVPTLEVELP